MLAICQSARMLYQYECSAASPAVLLHPRAGSGLCSNTALPFGAVTMFMVAHRALPVVVPPVEVVPFPCIQSLLVPGRQWLTKLLR